MVDKLFPPGARIVREMFFFGAMVGFVIGGGLTFFVQYWSDHGELYDVHAGIRVLNPAKEMPPLSSLVSGRLVWFFVLLISSIMVIIIHYASFYRESRSIYLMKRIPNRAELHVRCLTVPLLAIAIGLIIAYVLFLLFVWCYFRYTPEPCLPEQTVPTFWRALL
ncbi:MAG: hypothetical protein J5645_08685 [Lachnospiraceae bacterium]|nr:hypothetical protein [Lachnospiraceae bacterium]